MNLKEILEKHEIWLNEEQGGERADLRYANLRDADLSDTNLWNADLRYADLRDANLRYANLSDTNLTGANLTDADLRNTDLTGADLKDAYLKDADLRDANLRYADLRYADLRYANLTGANLRNTDLMNADLKNTELMNADLRDANLRYADLTGIKTNVYTIGYNLACPEEGSFIGYKKAGKYLVKLLILKDSKRSSATTSKCRCDKAKVLNIEDIITGLKVMEVSSDYNPEFIYRVGEIVAVDNFDDNRWNECAPGIHFFMNRENAINY